MTRERAILERFLRAEAMAKYALRSAMDRVPEEVQDFLRRQEAQEAEHQQRFERITGLQAQDRGKLPKMPMQWNACAVRLLGYEALGYEFAQLALAETSGSTREMVAEILVDEAEHVRFYEEALKKILDEGGPRAEETRHMAGAFLRRLPKTVERYLRGAELAAFQERVLEGVRRRFGSLGRT